MPTTRTIALRLRGLFADLPAKIGGLAFVALALAAVLVPPVQADVRTAQVVDRE